MNEGNSGTDYRTNASYTYTLSSIDKKLKTNHPSQSYANLQSNMLTRILARIFTDTPKTPLGRWATCTTAQQTALKTNYANEDHCGSCGEYMIQKREKKDSEEEYLYYMIESVPDQSSTRKIEKS